ncbi:zinc ribbon domain-containing protein [Candidatus Aerophobetes bacterium]|uniref:Zinc ribbon domain-containing protein n=1 Tax=Aerophobetes bacterium TaxID=2030807 RepID=A0A497E624_UNCAE|nr:MAG: zinc ribbon domain-containing protein [Candidatus Aerophobetes bacterium]
MPLYRYKCSRCGEEFVRLIRAQDKEEIRCDKCGSSDLERLISKFSIGRGKTGKNSSSRVSSCSTCSARNCSSCGR